MKRKSLRKRAPAAACVSGAGDGADRDWVLRAFTAAARQLQAGFHEEARQILVLILEREPRHADSLYLLASIAGQSGDLALAEDLLKQALALERKTPYWVLLGNVMQKRQRLTDSAECYRQALGMDILCADAYYNWGNTLELQGRNREATECFEQTLVLMPGHTQAHNNLGNQYRQAGRLEEAEKHLLRARELDPRSMPVLLNLGNVYTAQARHEEALALLDLAAGGAPGYAIVHNNRGNTLRNLNRVAEALDAYNLSIALEPGRAELHINRGIALQMQGRLGEALASFRRAIALAPEVAAAHGAALFTLHYDPAVSNEDLLEAHRAWGARHGEAGGRGVRPFANTRDPERRLRVGYVSPDFRQHPVAFFTAPVLEGHDRERCEVFCYSGATKPDAWTGRVRSASAGWRDTAALSDLELAAAIEADGVDVLVDLSGHTSGNRLLAFARKPAPVQISWLGYFNTTGLAAMDYLIVDGVIAPVAERAPFVEQPLRLDGCYLSYRGPDYAPAPAARADGPPAFGCFNTLSKISPEVIALWARLLAEEPEARLVLKNSTLDDAESRRLYGEAFAAHGIAAGRVELLGQSPHAELLAHYARIQVALDPFPYNGGTSTCEALWMGVPVVTRCGGRFVSRVGATILYHAGCGDWIAHTDADYIALARRLLHDAPPRAALRERVRASALGDIGGFTRRLEDVYRLAWRRYCAGAPSA